MDSVLNAVKGGMIALASSLVIAILFAYLFRLPVPMVGLIGPFGTFSSYAASPKEVVQMVLLAWVFYGLFGGIIVLLVCGAVTGVIVGNSYSATKYGKNKMIALWSASVSAVPVFFLSILDFIIGPW
jgi:heme/copper-type cytochrome/quinol oxidase subunit 2